MTRRDPDLVISFLTLRKAIGWIGILMPIAVRVGAKILDDVPAQTSVSGYYYTGMRDVFVGSLFAVGVFLFCYRETNRLDNVLTNVAGLLAVCVGVFPTDLAYVPGIAGRSTSQIHYDLRWAGPLGVHIFVAAAFFVVLSYLVTFRFPRLEPGQGMTEQKRRRNVVYRVCGVVMLVSLATIVGLKAIDKANPVFWPETFLIAAFSIAWLTKGRTILDEVPGDPAAAGRADAPSALPV